MSTVRRYRAAAVIAGLAVVGIVPERTSMAGEPAPARGTWDAAARVGYGSAWTTGVSSLGVGVGGSVGYVLPVRIRFELVLLWSAGDTDDAGNGAFRYAASYSSLHGTAAVAYEIPIGPVRLRPGIEGGATLIYGYTTVGAATLHDDKLRFIVGPALSGVVRIERFDVGLAAEAFFVPTWVAAPRAGIYALTGMRF